MIRRQNYSAKLIKIKWDDYWISRALIEKADEDGISLWLGASEPLRLKETTSGGN